MDEVVNLRNDVRLSKCHSWGHHEIAHRLRKIPIYKKVRYHANQHFYNILITGTQFIGQQIHVFQRKVYYLAIHVSCSPVPPETG